MVVPDYRKYPVVKVAPMYDDVRSSIQWAYDHAEEFNGDRDNIFVMVSCTRHPETGFMLKQRGDQFRVIALVHISLRKLFYPILSAKLKRMNLIDTGCLLYKVSFCKCYQVMSVTEY